MDPSSVLTALADLAPTGARRDQNLNAIGGRPVWLATPDRIKRGAAVDRLAAVDVLHRDQRIIRRGWAFLLGSMVTDGVRRQVRLPLLSEPVRLRQRTTGYKIVSAGDLEVTPLLGDPELAAALESVEGVGTAEWLVAPETLTWLRQAATAAAGVEVSDVRLRPTDISRAMLAGRWPPKYPAEGLMANAATALYVGRETFSGGMRDTLLNWAGRSGLAETAVAAVYGLAGEPEAGGDRDPGAAAGEVLSPLPLNEAQAEVVRRARTDRLVVVSGPPGSGKSHAVVAAALEVVDRGGSVLLATQSTHAAEVLGELLDRYPGPTPVLFGDAERRDAIATQLGAGTGPGQDDATLKADAAAVAGAAGQVRQLAAATEAALELEHRAAALAQWGPLLPALRADLPGLFGPGADPDRAANLVDRVYPQAPPDGPPVGGWWRRYQWRRARRKLQSLTGGRPGMPLERLRAAVEASRADQAAARLATDGGTDLAPVWRAWRDAEAALAGAVGTAMRHRAASARRWDQAARRSAAALASALRAGRNRRRQLLAAMDGPALVRALPLWVGTATDVEDLLPPVPGLFDLVVLDEASHLDQLRAAPVLARAVRAVVVGDPRQLRFVSFVADVDIAATLRLHDLDERVDVRRVSAFDLAAGSAPVTWLDEHFRSVPHLIEFSASRFYDGKLSVATRHPRNESLDVIDVVRVPEGMVAKGVNAAEVAAALAVVQELAAAGQIGIAVVSPFRAQADALEAALLKAFPVAELERLGLRVGTVHAFQGSEAHTVVASLGLVEDDSAARVRFVADPNLLNVLVTRARERMIVVTSLTGAAGGLVGDYLAFSEGGPPAPAAPDPDHQWTVELAAELRRAGLRVQCDYPVGRWTVDLCVGEGAGAVGLTSRVHPGGPAAHGRRQRSLARAGWRLVDAFASRWGGDPVRAALDLAGAHFTMPAPPLPLHSTS